MGHGHQYGVLSLTKGSPNEGMTVKLSWKAGDLRKDARLGDSHGMLRRPANEVAVDQLRSALLVSTITVASIPQLEGSPRISSHPYEVFEEVTNMERKMAKPAMPGMACSSEDLIAKRSLHLDREPRERVLQLV